MLLLKKFQAKLLTTTEAERGREKGRGNNNDDVGGEWEAKSLHTHIRALQRVFGEKAAKWGEWEVCDGCVKGVHSKGSKGRRWSEGQPTAC